MDTLKTRPRFAFPCLTTFAALGLATLAARADTNSAVQVGVALSNAPAGQELVLTWPASPGAAYVVEQRSRLDGSDSWKPFDQAVPAGTQGVLRITIPVVPAGSAAAGPPPAFYRLLLPQPAISGIEPARFAFGGPVELFVLGQCFDTNAELRIGPLTLTNRIIVSPTLQRVSFTPPAPGPLVVDLVVTGVVVSSFPLECYNPAAPPPSVLQSPPTLPWAAPEFRELTGPEAFGASLEDTGAGSLPPAALKAKEKANRTKCKSNVDQLARVAPSGQVELDQVDLHVQSRGLDFIWARSYRSLSGPSSAQGNRWDFSYNVSVSEVADGMVVRDGTGRTDLFRRDAEGFYGRDEHFSVGTLTGGVFRLTFADTGFWEFLPLDGSPAAGRLARIVDRNANSLQLQYDALGRLERVIDTLNRTNTIAYNPQNGRIASVTDFSGRRVSYTYYRAGEQGGSDGDLRTVTSPAVTGTPNGNDFPAGKTITFTYTRGFQNPLQNSLLLSFTDAKGQTPHRFIYQHNQSNLDFLRCLGRQAGTTNDRILYTYLPRTPSPANRYMVQTVVINDRVGNVSEHDYDARHRRLALRQFTGRATPGLPVTDTVNRPVNPLRPEDPAFFETRYEWNADSLCTRVQHPRGNATETVHQRVQDHNSSRSNKSRQHHANPIVLRQIACCGGADTDGDGAPDTLERAWRFQHDPRFGTTRASGKDTNGYYVITLEEILVSGLTAPGPGGGGGGSIWNFHVWTASAFTRVTDPRGSALSAQYDDHGNCLMVNPRAARDNFLQGGADVLEALRFAYNAHGQLIAVTNAVDSEGCRRVDTLEYGMDPAGPSYGYLTRAIRDDHSQLCGSTPHFRHTTTFEHDPRGNVIRTVDARGFDTICTYNALDQVVKRDTEAVPALNGNPSLRYATTFSFDANDNLVQVDHENRDHTGALDAANPLWSSGADYDLLDRVTGRWHELAHVVQGGPSTKTNRLAYDGNGNLVLDQSPEAVKGADPDNVIAYQYDERNLPFQILPAPGTGLAAVDRFDYDGNGNCTRVRKIDAFTIKQTVLLHDGFDRRVRVTDALGNVQTFAYDRIDNLVLERLEGESPDVDGGTGNRRLREARRRYDDIALLTEYRPAFFDIFTGLPIGDGEAVTTFTYAPDHRLLTATDDNGRTTRHAYDSAGRLARVTDPATNVVQYAYDACGNPTNVTRIERSDLGGEQRFSERYEYDALSRLTHRTDNVGNNENWIFDSRNNVVRHTDPRGTLTGWSYDGLSRVTMAIADLDGDGLLDFAADAGTAWAYDDNSRVVSVIDDNGNETRYGYDALDRLVLTTHADKSTSRLIWSPRHNVDLRLDANGTVVSNSYDLLDRCVRRDILPGPGVASSITVETFTYDGASRLVQAAADGAAGPVSHSFVWNSCADLAEQSSGGLSLRATHDGVGNRLTATYPSGRVVQCAYNAVNRPISLATAGAAGLVPVANYAYDGPGRLARIARPNGVNTRINWNGLENPANTAGDRGWRQVARVNHQVAQGGAFVDNRVSAFDAAQNRVLRAQAAPFSAGSPTLTNTFAFDRLHRLTRGTARRGPTIERDAQYDLDGHGNRLAVTQDGVAQPYTMAATLPEPADAQMNQYTSSPFGAHTYDRNGNLLSSDQGAGPVLYSYDYADRLVRVERTVGPATFPVADYAYDALGRRIRQTVFPAAPAAPVTTTWFRDADSDDDGVIEEWENGVLRRTHILPHVFETKNGVMITGGGEVFHFHTDDLGTVLALTDAGGSVVERYEYDDFGKPTFLDSKGVPLVDPLGLPLTSSPRGNRFLFHGMEWDAETGLYSHSGPGCPAGRPYRGPGAYDPGTGQYLNGMRMDGGMPNRISMNLTTPSRRERNFAGHNPWSPRAAGGGRPSRCDTYVWEMAGSGGGGGGGSIDVMFNPREYTISKATAGRSREDVYVWKLKKEEGGRHTPFHNKYRPQYRTTDVTGEIELESGRDRVCARNILLSDAATPKISDFGMSRVCGDNTPIIRGSALGQVYRGRWRSEPVAIKSTTTGVEMFRKILDRGEAGDNVGLLLRGHRDVGGYRAGLIVPVAMDKGLRFAIREGGRTVGAGQVTEILK